jgi:hypothetical protein
MQAIQLSSLIITTSSINNNTKLSLSIRDEMNKTRSHLKKKDFLNQLNLLYIYICLYLQYILNSVFIVVFYAMS